jgi:hypothetical protein
MNRLVLSALRRRLVPPALVIAALSACGDAKVRQLDVGISKDSAVKILSAGAPADDTLPNFYRHNRYFMDSRYIDVYLYDPKNRDLYKDPLVADKELTPVIAIGDTLSGWGWGYMDEISKRYRIEIRTKAPN